MQLTTEQKQSIEQQRRADPNRRHFHLEFTPQQKADWERAVAEEMTHRDENIREGRELLKALYDDSFSGELRRAIVSTKRNVFELGETIGISRAQMADFLAGNASLPSDAIDRLLRELNLNFDFHAPSKVHE